MFGNRERGQQWYQVIACVVSCFIYWLLVIAVDSIGNYREGYARVVLLEQLVWLIPLGVILFFWIWGTFRKCDENPFRMILAVVMVVVLLGIVWPLRRFDF
jgi:hypothetical protein